MKQDNRDNSRNWQTTNTGGTNYTGEIHFHGSDPNSPLTRQEYRNRQALLNKVKNFWVKGVLEKSLYNQVLIELGLEERLDAVNSSWNLELETAGETQKPLPKGTKVISIFDQLGEGRTLLILGEPGAGKTTALLELTRDLITRTEPSLDSRIPVVLNLSSWAGKKQSIADWLVEELRSKYQIPKAIGLDWVKKQELLLLLDGLDEVKAEHRDSCVAALNDFQQNYAAEMVVCSRIKDYENLSNRLTFQSAIYLRSLTPEQICQYLDNIKADLTGLKALIEGDTALQELAKSPLMLSIMVLAYEGVAAEDLPNTDVVEERRKQLFDAYITRMFHRPTRLKVEQRYSETQSIHWLTWLAQRMVQESQTIFLIEYIQPYLLQTSLQKTIYLAIFYLTIAFLLGFILSIVISVNAYTFAADFVFRIFLFVSLSLLFSVVAIVLAWLNIGIEESIYPITAINWLCLYPSIIFKIVFSIFFIKRISKLIIKCVTFALLIGLIIWTFFGLRGELSYLFIILNSKEFIFFLIIELLLVAIYDLLLILALGLIRSKSRESVAPNQGIRVSAKTAITFTLISTVAIWLLSNIGSNSDRLVVALGLIISMLCGGASCLKHLALRLTLYFNGYIPWNYARFLDYAAERIFLQKVGGGYIFIHRLLLEHFAQMKLGR